MLQVKYGSIGTYKYCNLNPFVEFRPGRSVKGHRLVEGNYAADMRLATWLVAQVGKDYTWLTKELGMDKLPLVADRVLTELPKAKQWRLDRVGPDARYSAIFHNCNMFTGQALDIYLGCIWHRPMRPSDPWSSSEQVLTAWDRSEKMGSNGRPPRASSTPSYTIEIIPH